MTAQQLSDRHNKLKTVKTNVKVCEHFLNRYNDKVINMSDEEIFNTFETWFYNMCYM